MFFFSHTWNNKDEREKKREKQKISFHFLHAKNTDLSMPNTHAKMDYVYLYNCDVMWNSSYVLEIHTMTNVKNEHKKIASNVHIGAIHKGHVRWNYSFNFVAFAFDMVEMKIHSIKLEVD